MNKSPSSTGPQSASPEFQLRPLTPTEAKQHRSLALSTYSETNAKYGDWLATGWPLNTLCWLAAVLLSWRQQLHASDASPHRRLCTWLACGAVPCLAARPLARLFLWLVSTRRLPDYADFAGFWTTDCNGGGGKGSNCIYGAFVSRDGDTAKPQDLAAVVAVLHVDATTCQLQRLAVSPCHRGRGVGGAVSRRLMAVCAGLGYRRMLVGTTALQPAAERIYRGLGFRVVREDRWLLCLPGVTVYSFERGLL